MFHVFSFFIYNNFFFVGDHQRRMQNISKGACKIWAISKVGKYRQVNLYSVEHYEKQKVPCGWRTNLKVTKHQGLLMETYSSLHKLHKEMHKTPIRVTKSQKNNTKILILCGNHVSRRKNYTRSCNKSPAGGDKIQTQRPTVISPAPPKSISGVPPTEYPAPQGYLQQRRWLCMTFWRVHMKSIKCLYLCSCLYLY